MEQKQSKLLQTCSQLSFAMMALYFADIILLGTGALTRVGPVSSRIALFALAVLFAVPVMLQRLKQLLRNPYLIAVAVFLVWLAIAAVRGYRAGNPMHVLKADVKGYMNYAILPVMLCVLDSEKRIHKLMKVIVYASFIMGIASVVMSFYTYFPNWEDIYAFCDEFGFCGITRLHRRAMRVFFHTASRYYFVAYLFALYFFCRENSKKWKLFWMTSMTLSLFGIFSSYSRSIYASAVLGVLAVFVLLFRMPKEERIQVVRTMLISAGCVLVLILVLSVIQSTSLIGVALERVLEVQGLLGEDLIELLGSMDERELTLEELARAGLTRQYELMLLGRSMAECPIIGHGLGKNIPPFDFVEYSYHDVINKSGVIGLVLMFVPFILMICNTVKQKKLGNLQKPEIWMSVLTALVAAGYFLFIAYSNPCMNTTVGISCYCLCMAQLTYYLKPKTE